MTRNIQLEDALEADDLGEDATDAAVSSGPRVAPKKRGRPSNASRQWAGKTGSHTTEALRKRAVAMRAATRKSGERGEFVPDFVRNPSLLPKKPPGRT